MAKLKTTTAEIINEINVRDIIITLQQKMKTSSNDSAAVRAAEVLAKITGVLDDKTKVEVKNYNNLMDAITDDVGTESEERYPNRILPS